MFSPELILSFFTLTFLEIILGIDNLLFIAVVVSNLPSRYSNKARSIGIGLALIIRVLMLMTLNWVMDLTDPLFTIYGLDFSFNHLLLALGGLFLMVKSGLEIYRDINHLHDNKAIAVKESFLAAVIQIAAVDFIFSFDSIITAIAMTRNIPIIVAAIVASMLLMFLASGQIGKILKQYPSLKIVALAFIFMIGFILLADGLHWHISKTYLYFALFFTILVESLNILARRKHQK